MKLQMTHLAIEKLTVKPARIVCDVRVSGVDMGDAVFCPDSLLKLNKLKNGSGQKTASPMSAMKQSQVARYLQTTPQLISAVLEYYPTLLHHACVNDEGDTFAAVADHTSLPHLLEHLVIAMQVEAEAKSTNVSSSPTTFVGTTEWTDLRTNRARVEVNYRDDLVALRSFSESSALINRLLHTTFI